MLPMPLGAFRLGSPQTAGLPLSRGEGPQKVAPGHFHDCRHSFAGWWCTRSTLTWGHLREQVAKTGRRAGQNQHMISTKQVESPAGVA